MITVEQIKWDNQAKADLKLIFEYIKLDSLKNTKKLIKEIVSHSKSIKFVEQYQVDEFLGEPFRRMIISHYKIVYKIKSETAIRILQIFDMRQNQTKSRV